MQNFIVWMNPDREESAAAVAKLNGAVLVRHTDGVMAAIGRELKRCGFDPDLAVFAQTCEEFAKQANSDMVCISRSDGDAVAAVIYLEDGYAGEGVSAVADLSYLMSAYRQYFHQPDKAVVFQGALSYLSDEDIAWLYSRHSSAIVEWQSNGGLGLYEFGFSLCDILNDGIRHVLREVVCGWLHREILPELSAPLETSDDLKQDNR